MIIPLKMQIDL